MQAKLFLTGLFLLTAGIQMGHSQMADASSSMEKAEVINFSKPDDIRTFPLGKLELSKIGGAMIGKAIFQPGWSWNESVKPLAKTESCLAPHFQYHVSGILRVKMDDGTTFDCKPGDVSYLPMGHDAWVVGDEPVVVIDFQGMIDYASSKNPHKH